jgi:hypothetical protein
MCRQLSRTARYDAAWASSVIFFGLLARVLHRTAELGLCSIHIAISAQEEVDGPAGLVYSPIQLDPAAR